ncbi:MAG: GTP 3',8-cyclase MoaA [Gammaproteobacteria bacterium]|nr:GTP 3',8-cyclase MoaA [Gammaproteobacteria bacterium]
MTPLTDPFGRSFPYLRLSLTEACNFRCGYCLPDGYQPSGSQYFLTVDECQRVAAAFAAAGASKIRLTGGEPTLRRDFTDIAAVVAAVPGIRTLAMTTNGYRLQRDVARWRAAGINQLNVSIDSLDPRSFAVITGSDSLHQILDGLELALTLGFNAVKVNAVILRDYTDHDWQAFLALVRDKPLELRFIELMQTANLSSTMLQQQQSGERLRNRLLAAGWQPVSKGYDDGPAEHYRHPDYAGRIGLILPYGRDFCDSCNRLRVSARGKLHLCLFGTHGVELRDLLQQDEQQLLLLARIRQALKEKRISHFLHEGDAGITSHLAAIGG